MLAETKPGRCFIVVPVASTSNATSCRCRAGSTLKTLISVSTRLPFSMCAMMIPSIP